MAAAKKLELKSAKTLLKKEKSKLSVLKEEAIGAAEAVQFLQAVAAEIQSAVHERLSGIVSMCLASVFDQPYEFKIHFDKKRNRTEARIVFTRGGEEFDPKTECGGGVVDVAAFAVRVAALILTKPPQRRLVILDEPFRFVSKKEYLSRLRKMLETLASEFKIQFIIVTHEPDLQSGCVVTIGD